jgi:hypothetical protein
MSLEQALDRNTEAMIIMTRALNMVALPVAMGVKLTKAEVKEAEVPKPVEAVVAVTHPAASTATDTTPEAPIESLPPADTTKNTALATKAIEYAEVAAAIVATFKTDRVKTIDALARFNATKGPQLKPEDYAAFLKVLQA